MRRLLPTPRAACLAWTAIAIMTSGFVAAAPAGADTGCHKVASTTGSDSAAGSATSPYRTLQKLADSLSPGQTGCLRGGTYKENPTVRTAGSSTARIVIRSYTGERATVFGRLVVSNSANFVTFSRLNLDGSACASSSTCTLPSPTVYGDDIRFTDNDVTNRHTGICFNVGSSTYGRAYRLTIERNRIHNCGRLPASNHDHGIYLQRSTGARIVGNLIYDNADRGVQLYPDAQGTYIARNVIDGNGEGIMFSGDYGVASSGTVVERNLITNSKIRNNVESWYPAGNPVGERNVVQQNCIHGGARDDGDGGIGTQRGFVAVDNRLVDPLYVDRPARDFRLRPGSPCLPLTGDPAAELSHDGGSAVPAPNKAPIVTLTKPIDGAVVSKLFSMAADASDDEGVVKVEFRVGSWLVATDSSAPYTASVSGKHLPRGSHTVSATAYDPVGLTAVDSATVVR